MNRLQYETSPYLLQHAGNPVDWYAWKPEAFERAKQENKPILVSIGYSTCHWCHVMEKESFEREHIADFMNQYFINIKVDREERPDVDQIYMEACQFINGSGCGWPLNCFLTPDGRPFYAGTYFPPQPKYNRPSWTQVLERIAYSFNEKRETVEEQANQLTTLIKEADDNLFSNQLDIEDATSFFTALDLTSTFHKIQQRFDNQDGGFGGAPKFPSSMSLHFLLQYHFLTADQAALHHVEFSLQRMIQGGIYDQLGGGFARYATDKAWLIPHFEKMLYDNALLISLLSDAYKLTQKTIYKETIIETLDYVAREMTSTEGGFYAAQDADSEGVEGKFYVWSKAEIDTLLDQEAALFNDFYGVSEFGNWEHTNILWRAKSYEQYAAANDIPLDTLKEKLAFARQQLFAVRSKRIPPGLDDKILLDWNALMCKAYTDAYQALGVEAYKTIAVKNIAFLLSKFAKGNELELYHTYKNGQAQYDAFLNDYAFLIDALIGVYEITFDLQYLEQAVAFCEYTIAHFLDQEQKMFYFTSAKQEDLVLRKKDLYDSAQPSGNSTMVINLQRLAILTDDQAFQKLALEMLINIKTGLEKYPTSFGRWATAVLNEIQGISEIAVIGTTAVEKAKALQANFLPPHVVMATIEENEQYPLLIGKIVTDETMIYVCRNYACQRPEQEVETVLNSLKLMAQFN